MIGKRFGACSAVLCCALTLGVRTAVAQPAKEGWHGVPPVDFGKLRYESTVTSGDCTAAGADVGSRRVWAAVLGCAQSPQVTAGLKLQPLTNSGAQPYGKIVATFEVTQVVGSVMLEVLARQHGSPSGTSIQWIKQPGRYTLVSHLMKLQVGLPYEAIAEAFVAPCRELCGVSMKIVEIKWEFQGGV